MLYWQSNTGTTASIDYTNRSLDGACYIGGATLEQQHLLIIPMEHWMEHVILGEQHLTNSMYCFTNGALDRACYIGGPTLEQQHILIIPEACYIGGATLEQQHVLIIPTGHLREHVILA